MTLTSEEQNNVSACMDSNWKQASCTEKIMKRNPIFTNSSLFCNSLPYININLLE